MNDTHDDASTLLDDNVPLGEFLDEQLVRPKAFENAETDEELETENLETPIRYSTPRYELPKIRKFMFWMRRQLETFLLAMIGMILRNYYAN